MKYIAALLIVLSSNAMALEGFDSPDRSFPLMDDVTGRTHYITNRSIEACKSMPHYSVVEVAGVKRRCITSIKWQVWTKEYKG